jgi:adenylate kinase
VQRADDREETIRERLRVYQQSTAELIPYYQKQGLLREIDGQGDIETIYRHVVAALG